jgi:hypothetical protein
MCVFTSLDHENKRIRGSSVGSDVLMSWNDPSPRAVTRVGIAMYYTIGFWRFGFPYNSTSKYKKYKLT